jgi:hypothetical protein
VFSLVRAAVLATQRRAEHISAAMNPDTTIEELFSMWSVPRCYKQGTRSHVRSVPESVKRGLESVKLKNLQC